MISIKEFKPRFKSAKTRFKISAVLNLERNIWYNFKWNQPYISRDLNLNRRSNSLNSASDQTSKQIGIDYYFIFIDKGIF